MKGFAIPKGRQLLPRYSEQLQNTATHIREVRKSHWKINNRQKLITKTECSY